MRQCSTDIGRSFFLIKRVIYHWNNQKYHQLRKSNSLILLSWVNWILKCFHLLCRQQRRINHWNRKLCNEPIDLLCFHVSFQWKTYSNMFRACYYNEVNLMNIYVFYEFSGSLVWIKIYFPINPHACAGQGRRPKNWLKWKLSLKLCHRHWKTTNNHRYS